MSGAASHFSPSRNMATNDLKVVQEQADGSFKEITTKPSAIVVANKAARKNPATYAGLGITPYTGMRVVQTDQNYGGYPTVEYLLNGTDVAVDGGWFLQVLAHPVTGELVMDLRLADFTGIVPPVNSIGQVGGVPRYGDGITEGGMFFASAGFGASSSCIIAQAGDDLAAKYTLAKALYPNGASKSTTNRATLVIAPGAYTLSAEWAVDTEFIDVLALGSSSQNPTVFLKDNTISVTANDVRVTGISVGTQAFLSLGDSKTLQIFTNCRGGDGSFGSDGYFSGTITNCIAGPNSFSGRYGHFSGTATNCIAGDYSFGKSFSGVATDCKGGDVCFGNGAGTAAVFSGTVTNCTAGNASFGGGICIFSGIAKNCKSGSSSFGGSKGTFSGTATNCTAGGTSFGGDSQSNASTGICSGTATNCTAGYHSFGGTNASVGILSGKLYYCRLTYGTFRTISGSGQTRYCLDATNVANNQG